MILQKSISITFLLLLSIITKAQHETVIIRADINNNSVVDVLKTSNNGLWLTIDDKKFFISLETLDFERFYDLSFKKNVLTISGGYDGTGMFSHTYKFRHNPTSKDIELIGYESFYKWNSGNVTKSYNVATGNYKVIVEQYNERKQEMESKTYQDKAIIKKIALLRMKKSSLDHVAKVGSKYEPKLN